MKKVSAILFWGVVLIGQDISVGQSRAAFSAPTRKDIPSIAQAATGAVVSIIMSRDGNPIAQGSGFLISPNGIVITNYHVIATGDSAAVKLPDGVVFPVDAVLATDKRRDLAVIKIHGKSFRTLTLGNSDQLQVGEEVVAIGNPLSLESTVSNGIVSGIRIAEKLGGKFLQITTPISPGSSGGPLFNMAGEVVGITTLKLEGGDNLNFAIPINDAKRLLLANSSRLQNLPNEPEPEKTRRPRSAPKTPEAEAPPPESLEERLACANLVAKDEKEKQESEQVFSPDVRMTIRMYSYFSPQSSICFEIMTRNIVVRAKGDASDERIFAIEISDAIEKITFATFGGNESRPYGEGYVGDTKGDIFSFGGDTSIKMSLPDFWDLVFAKLGVKNSKIL